MCHALCVCVTHCRWWRGSAKLLKQLTGAPLEVAETVRQQLLSFQQHLPLIAALRNPGLRDRHWDKISAAVGCTVKADTGTFCQHQAPNTGNRAVQHPS
jgi:hypothetical protein